MPRVVCSVFSFLKRKKKYTRKNKRSISLKRNSRSIVYIFLPEICKTESSYHIPVNSTCRPNAPAALFIPFVRPYRTQPQNGATCRSFPRFVSFIYPTNLLINEPSKLAREAICIAFYVNIVRPTVLRSSYATQLRRPCPCGSFLWRQNKNLIRLSIERGFNRRKKPSGCM